MDFINITAIDIIDVLLVAMLMYQLYRLIRGTNAISIFVGILMVYLLWIIVRMLGMELLSLILGQIIGVGVIALIIVFQPEIRKFLFILGERYSKRKGSFWRRLLFGKVYTDPTEWVDEIADACVSMAASRTGALIVITRHSDISDFTDRGEIVDANIKKHLIESIFFKNSPLHDGAMIVENGRIKAARCILPVSDRGDLPTYLGTRHRAAVGATEVSDAVVVVVSEERGHISIVDAGNIVSVVTKERIVELITKALEYKNK